jgi:hypothetical protein
MPLNSNFLQEQPIDPNRDWRSNPKHEHEAAILSLRIYRKIFTPIAFIRLDEYIDVFWSRFNDGFITPNNILQEVFLAY